MLPLPDDVVEYVLLPFLEFEDIYQLRDHYPAHYRKRIEAIGDFNQAKEVFLLALTKQDSFLVDWVLNRHGSDFLPTLYLNLIRLRGPIRLLLDNSLGNGRIKLFLNEDLDMLVHHPDHLLWRAYIAGPSLRIALLTELALRLIRLPHERTWEDTSCKGSCEISLDHLKHE